MERPDEGFDRPLAVVARRDDLEDGASSVAARGSAAGKHVGYAVVTDGEEGIDGLRPARSGTLRRAEQVAAAAVVGVGDVVLLGAPDGRPEYGIDLRTSLAREIRRFRPDAFGPAAFLHETTIAAGHAVGVGHAVAFEELLTLSV